jgi:hypothetical protein
MTDPKPKRSLGDVAEDWANPGQYDTSADFAAIATTRRQPHISNYHDGTRPAAQCGGSLPQQRGGPELSKSIGQKLPYKTNDRSYPARPAEHDSMAK